ncbi:Lipid phosphate phosphatase 1 [Cucumispora dikerogammari]|nr:Lipid phosphate phosphatase 1 [Cucumispora dikerogammari]
MITSTNPPKYLALKLIVLTTLLLFIAGSLFITPNIPWPPTVPITSFDIKKPLKKETISMSTLGIIVTSLILFSFLIFYFVDTLTPRKTAILFDFLICSTILYTILFLFMQGVKLYAGEPRPNFYAMCNPDRLGYCDISTQQRVKLVIFGRTSFPSGHSATITFFGLLTALVIITYPVPELFQAKVGFLLYSIFSITSITMIGFLIIFVCYSRIWDYYHRVIDVVVGAVMGIIVSVIAIPIKKNIFKKYFQ